MKKLFIIRHAKSSWKDLNLSDFDRPLNKRGKSNAPLMASRLKEKGVLPDIILSSPALRAKSTALKIAKKLNYTQKILFDQKLYDSDISALDSILKNLDKKANIVFIFGHNPELNMLAQHYVGFYENIPTCGIIEIEFNSKNWKNISRDNATFISFDYPKKL